MTTPRRTRRRWRVRKVAGRWEVQRQTWALCYWWTWAVHPTHAQALAHADAEARRGGHQRDYTLAAGGGRLA